MGTVYRARDPILDRPVALKTVAPELLAKADTMARFQREARAAARLQHPNIVTIYELGETDGTLFIAMELLEGMDLAAGDDARRDACRSQHKLRIVIEICRGLDFAHKRGVVHRDVKPANIRILHDGSVKIVDFGIARLEDSTHDPDGARAGHAQLHGPRDAPAAAASTTGPTCGRSGSSSTSCSRGSARSTRRRSRRSSTRSSTSRRRPWTPSPWAFRRG